MRFVLAVLACAGCADPIGARELPLVNASDEPGLTAVVPLYADGELFCTGTVIAPRVVLTATHCLAGAGSQAAIAVDFDGDRIDADDALRHPDWRFDGLGNDIAVVALADDAPVEPLPLRTRALTAADEGAMVTLVGFGLTSLDGDDDGVRRSGQAPITGVGDTQLSINGGAGSTSACPGDSGGPSIYDGEIAGVHSRASCATLTQDERVDVHVADFVQPFIDDHPAGDGGCAAGGGGGPAPWGLLLLVAATGARLCGRSRARARSRSSSSCAP